jgi:hypothetical protein
MIRRDRWVSIAIPALLTVASVCLAQDAPPSTPPADTTLQAAPGPPIGPGFAAIGGGIGVSQFTGSEDYSAGAEMRLAFAGRWRYQWSRSLRLEIGTGFTWAGYDQSEPAPFVDPRPGADIDGKGEWLTLLVPTSAQIQYLRPSGWWLYHAGIGPGIYRVWVQNERDVVEDPITFKPHRGVYPGFSFQIGAERFFRGLTTTSIEFGVTGHQVFATRDDQFPSGMNSNLSAVEGRIGVNYYWDLSKPRGVAPRP